MESLRWRMPLSAFNSQPSNGKRKRPVLTSFDRLFWVGLSLIWNGWRAALAYVQPDTVVRWQRERFRKFWARLSRVNRRLRGRPATAVTIRRLIEGMVAANPLWRAPRIHGELKMLGIEISERTVSRILRTLRRPPTQTWKTFLHNHVGQRRDCLNHFMILNARHLKRTLASYFAYYHGSRTHLGLDKQCPIPRQVSSIGRIITIPQLGGLHHRYERVAA